MHSNCPQKGCRHEGIAYHLLPLTLFILLCFLAGELNDTLQAAHNKAAGICCDLAAHFKFNRNFQEVRIAV